MYVVSPGLMVTQFETSFFLLVIFSLFIEWNNVNLVAAIAIKIVLISDFCMMFCQRNLTDECNHSSRETNLNTMIPLCYGPCICLGKAKVNIFKFVVYQLAKHIVSQRVQNQPSFCVTSHLSNKYKVKKWGKYNYILINL